MTEAVMERRFDAWFWACGAAISGGVAVERSLSRGFAYGQGHAARPIVPFVLIFLLASAAYAIAVFSATKIARRPSRRAGVALWGLALLPRLVFLDSNPFQESDFYRYLWDGSAVLAGVNPYRYSPDEVRRARPGDGDAALARLASVRMSSARAAETLERINHPELSTVYPPASVAVFALSQGLAPFSLTGLRLVLLAFDLGTMALLWRLLGRLGLPQRAWVAYAWCPLVVLAVANNAHGDAIPVFFVTACLAALVEVRPVLASAALASAVLAKLYPLVLVPLLFAWIARHARKELLASLITFLSVGAGWSVVVGLPAARGHSGFLAYARSWESNSGLFALVESATGGTGARILCAGAVAGVVLWQTKRVGAAEGRETIVRAFACVVAAVFCLSPSQFPWYYVWVIPFLCFFPSAPWVLLSALLSLYYVSFWIEYNLDPISTSLGDGARRWLLIAEHLPFYIWLLADAYRSSATPSPWAIRFTKLK